MSNVSDSISASTLMLIRGLFPAADQTPIDSAEVVIPRERLEAIERLLLSGELFLSLSHEVNNMLTVVQGNVQLLQLEAVSPSARELVDGLAVATTQIQALLRSIRFLANGKPYQPHCDLRRLLGTTLALVLPLARDCHAIVDVVADAELYVPLLPHQMQQITLNLVMNSIQALEGKGGRVEVRAVGHGESVILTVRDTGRGVPPAVRDQLFDPFVSTKPDGTGLGLAIVRSILDQIGGAISLTDARPHHTTFTVRLPRLLLATERQVPPC